MLMTARALLDSPTRAFPVRRWNGEVLPPARDERLSGCVALASPRAIEALVPPSAERRLAEAFLDGDIELEGDAVRLLEAAARWEGPHLRPSLVKALLAAALHRRAARAGELALAAHLRGHAHSLARDRGAVQHHYDLSDAFYRLFLDRALVYSCAYFATGAESLEEAQEAKLDLVCRKLALAPGERLLDVGCGWGALLEHASARYQVDGLGVTLAEHQLAEARRRLARAEPGRRLAVLPLDYRRLPDGERFHKAVSVGMMEHVGRAHLDAYFSAIHRALLPGGLFLNHAIADLSPGIATLPWASRRAGGFIDRYIFPDGDLVPLHLVVAAAEKAGFEVRDVESLREHYAETLAAWLERLERRREEAEALVGRRAARAYRLYLASSAVAFRVGRISVFQLLLARRTEAGRAASVPRCRAAWYHPSRRRSSRGSYRPWVSETRPMRREPMLRLAARRDAARQRSGGRSG
jgi:cyclopropane-fatty-acyl-phospholipid synthase